MFHHHQVVKKSKNLESNFEKINKSVLSHIRFYLEDNNHKPVDFDKESFTSQPIEKK